MIPRYQRILFWTLAGCILLMTLFLLRGCEQAHKRLTASTADTTPIAAPTTSATGDVTLYLASDADGSITATTHKIALPQEPTLRARTLLQALLAEYVSTQLPPPPLHRPQQSTTSSSSTCPSALPQDSQAPKPKS